MANSARWDPKAPLYLAIAEKLAARPGITARTSAQLADALGYSTAKIRASLAMLAAWGLVERAGPPARKPALWRLRPGVTLAAVGQRQKSYLASRRQQAREYARRKREERGPVRWPVLPAPEPPKPALPPRHQPPDDYAFYRLPKAERRRIEGRPVVW